MTPEKYHFHCTSEWHFSRLTGRGADHVPLVYGLALRVSKESDLFYASVPHVCDYFSADQKSIRGALNLLDAIRFFRFVRAEAGSIFVYHVTHHSDWAKKNPGKCCEKQEKSAFEFDPLAIKLNSISSGRFRPYPNFVKGMRKHGHSDEAIAEIFREYIRRWQPIGKQWNRGLAGAFNSHLRDLASQPRP